MKRILVFFLILFLLHTHTRGDFLFRKHTDLSVSVSPTEEQVVHTALELFSRDYRQVFDARIVTDSQPRIVIATIGSNSPAEVLIGEDRVRQLAPQRQGFMIELTGDTLCILGSDKHGTAYGILELSRLIGVSPWEWWADSTVEKKDSVRLPSGFFRFEYPSVLYRGIFINDEDWGLMPWSYLTHEPSDIQGKIGPKTHARIFELLLRLRANTFWPAMHSCSVAFYMTPGNREMADKYGIVVGSSHCEPMARNTNAEWNIAGKGSYDYVNNREGVLQFWEERVRELSGSENIYTLGIRGIHDGPMQGAKTVRERHDALVNIFKDQRELIARHLNEDVTQVPQVFIPYKEVLEVYHAGLEVPDDVTLMWCDDNYGYIRYFPHERERSRAGGNGMYYHISYWGRPHDYLWLATNHPAQLFTQMKTAYDKGAKDLWIVNVGDIKPAEYLTELFLDMAWNIGSIENSIAGMDKHLYDWLSREFGEENAGDLLAVMNEYYRLAYIRKPEFMANTRTEEKDPQYSVISDLPWSEVEIKERIDQYQHISDEVIRISERIPAGKSEAWFQLIEYPVRGAAEMNKKHLYGQLARHGKADWEESDRAYQTIIALTEKYNSLGEGKWNQMMDPRPRKLPVFDPVPHTAAERPLPEYTPPVCLLNGNEYTAFTGQPPLVHGLGYQRGAISLPLESTVSYDIPVDLPDTFSVEVALAPNHPVEGKILRYGIQLNDQPMQIVEYQTQGRSEEWKENVLANRAKRSTVHQSDSRKTGRITIQAMDQGVVVDQIKIRNIVQ